MMQEALNICSYAIQAAVRWVDQLLAATGAGPVLFTAFCVCGVISMILIPLRGANGISFGDSYYTHNTIHRQHRGSRQRRAEDPGTSSSFSGVSSYD